jgi:hypothetical protein
VDGCLCNGKPFRDLLFRIWKELGIAVERERSFPVRGPGTEGRRPDLLLKDWENGKDLYIDVLGSSPLAVSNMRGFEPGGASRKAVAGKERSYRDILRAQPPSVRYLSFAFESLGGLHPDALAVVVSAALVGSLLRRGGCLYRFRV